jgi:hypothetical protein
MSAALLDRLVKLAGMFGSVHEGERAAAAAMADKLLREHGLAWPDVLRVPRHLPDRRSSSDKLDFALDHLDLLDSWKRCFVCSVNSRSRYPTPRQLDKLDEIVAFIEGEIEAEKECAA